MNHISPRAVDDINVARANIKALALAGHSTAFIVKAINYSQASVHKVYRAIRDKDGKANMYIRT
ncbi:Hypothetical protein FKW44_023121, partial [Caligus rogercresseyi]